MSITKHGLVIGLVAALAGVAPAAALEAGTKMPEVSLQTLSGKGVEPAALTGKVVVVDFWATWCSPCRESMPELEKLYKKYSAQGLTVVGVSVDKDASAIKPFIEKLQVTFPIVHDAAHSVADKFAPARMPSSYVIDRKGVVRYVHGGYHTGDAATLEKELQELLAK